MNPHVIHLIVFGYILLAMSLGYAVLLFCYVFSWSKLRTQRLDSSHTLKTQVTILIPCRNEAANIQALLHDLSTQTVPNSLFEVIVIDDFSSDDTISCVSLFESSLSTQIISLSDYIKEKDSSKKAALTIGVEQARGELIITIDADCRVGANWLQAMIQHYELSDHKIFTAPIQYHQVNGWISTFEALDVAGMMVITGGMHQAKMGLLANGANLAFKKKTFESVGGYTGKDHMASGDDVFLMEKINKIFPDSAGFLKSKAAIVKTGPQGNWTDFINQRTRWASKNHQYDSWKLPFQLSIPIALSWSLVVGLILVLLGLTPMTSVLVALFIKIIADLFLQVIATNFFNRYRWLWFFPIAEIFHIIYLIQVSIAAFRGRFSWKGRQF